MTFARRSALKNLLGYWGFISMNMKLLKATSAILLLPSFALGQSAIPATQFGMHDNNYMYGSPYPTVKFGSFRLWDLAGMTRWRDLETSRGVYNWGNLDNFISLLNSHGVTDIIYTFGYTPSWAGPAATLPPSNNQDFLDFISALATRYKGKITHYETWNEPYSSTFWTGTMGQLAQLQKDVYTTVKAIDPNATVHTPVLGSSSTSGDCSNSSASYGTGAFFSANGTANFDVVDLHLYPYPLSAGPAPETVGVMIANAKCSMNSSGIGSKPIWNTEFSWSMNSYLPSSTDQVAFVGRSHLYFWSQGIPRSYWYAYDNQSEGTLVNTGTGALTPAGVAYQQVYNWMSGATMTSKCALSNSIWTCGLTLANGHPALAVWLNVFKSSTTQSYTPPSQYDVYRDLAGNTSSVSGAVAIGERPVLFEDTSASTTAAPSAPTGLTAVAH
jgi:hypothetical protein